MKVYVEFLRELGHPDAEQRAAKLAELRGRITGYRRGALHAFGIEDHWWAHGMRPAGDGP